MLDNCSQWSFIHDSLFKKLDVTGTRTTITMKTLYGVRSEKTVSVEGVKVAQLQGSSSWLNPPKMYARRSLPVNIVVGLLISANCMKALEPMKIIPSKEDGPYAYKTLLGWCILGPVMNTEAERNISCHRVAVKDIISSASLWS